MGKHQGYLSGTPLTLTLEENLKQTINETNPQKTFATNPYAIQPQNGLEVSCLVPSSPV